MEWNFLRGTTFRILERMAHIFGKRAQVESFAHIEINKIENRRACPTVKMCPIPTFCITVLNFTTFLQQRVMLSSVRLWVCSECVFLPSSLPLSPHLHLHEIPSPCKHTYHGIEQLYKNQEGEFVLREWTLGPGPTVWGSLMDLSSVPLAIYSNTERGIRG